jgi:hypothetical protein
MAIIDNLMDAVHFSLYLPQASRGARDDERGGICSSADLSGMILFEVLSSF